MVTGRPLTSWERPKEHKFRYTCGERKSSLLAASRESTCGSNQLGVNSLRNTCWRSRLLQSQTLISQQVVLVRYASATGLDERYHRRPDVDAVLHPYCFHSFEDLLHHHNGTLLCSLPYRAVVGCVMVHSSISVKSVHIHWRSGGKRRLHPMADIRFLRGLWPICTSTHT